MANSDKAELKIPGVLTVKGSQTLIIRVMLAFFIVLISLWGAWEIFPSTPTPSITFSPTNASNITNVIEVMGTVKDEAGMPLKGVTVTLEVTPLSLFEAETDSDGRFWFEIPASEHGSKGKLTVEAEGYETLEKIIDLKNKSLYIELYIFSIPPQMAIEPTKEASSLPTATATTTTTTTTTATATDSLFLTLTPTERTPPRPTTTATPSIRQDGVDFSHLPRGKEVKVEGEIYRIVFSPDSRWLAAGTSNQDGGGTLYVWSVSRWDTQTKELPKPIRALAFGQVAGRMVLAAGTDGGRIYTLEVDKETGIAGQEVEFRFATEGWWPVYSMAFSPNGRWLAFGSWKQIGIWDVNRERLKEDIRASHDWPIYDIVFSPDGKIIASSGWDGFVRLWDLEGNIISSIEASDDVTYSVAFNRDGRRLAVGTHEDTISLWNLSNPSQPKEIGILKGHTGDVFTVAFSPTEDILASGGWDKTLKLWTTNSNKCIAELVFGSTVRNITFSPDGTMFAVAVKDTVIIWRVPEP